jgi:hypothetical protein
MPQTATQKASRSAAQPQPLTDAAAEIPDQEYALVSVLYHALQGAQACEQYIDDAEQAGDDELVMFFQECAQEQRRRASRAKQLLANNLDLEDEEEEDEDD